MMRIFSVVFFCLLFHSCLNVQRANKEEGALAGGGTISFKIDVSDFDATDIDSECNTFQFSEIFSDVNYVKLESTEESTIGRVSQLLITKDGDFVVFDRTNCNIVRFDSVGKFLNKIGERGKSREEYISPMSIAYDFFRNQIVVHDYSRHSLNYYDINGVFQEQIEFSSVFFDFGIINEDLIALHLNKVYYSKDKGTKYNLVVCNRQGEIISQYEPYDKDGNFRSSENVFSYNNGVLYYNGLYSPIVNKFVGKELVPAYTLDFGERQLPLNSFKENGNREDFNNFLRSYEHWSCQRFYETDNKYIMILISNSKYFVLYIKDKNTPKTIMKTYGYNDIRGLMEKNYFITQLHGNKIYMDCDPSEFGMIIDRLERFNEKAKDEDLVIIKEMSAHTNPIIQICTLK